MNGEPDGSLDRDREIFLDALERTSPDDRKAFLEGACGHDAALLARVESLLRHHAEDNFLEEPARADEDSPMSESAVSENIGTLIGRYKLREKIGEGGCGVVYVAEQEQPVRRKVALKIIKLGMDTKSVVARFEAERQALAMMDHPNIAKVLDAGATETGRPYFVMELVRGTRITDYCDQNQFSTAAAAEPVHPGLPGQSSTPTRKASSTATSSPPTSWSPSTTECRCPRSLISASPKPCRTCKTD